MWAARVDAGTLQYALQLKAEFPGQGSIVRIELPINIGSGVQSSVPLSADVSPTSPWMIDLPAYVPEHTSYDCTLILTMHADHTGTR